MAATENEQTTGTTRDECQRGKRLKRYNSLRDLDSKWTQEEILKKCNTFDYDIFATAKLIGTEVMLNVLGDAVMNKLMDYPKYLQVDSEDMKQFLAIMHAGYRGGNPYHNAIHATDVMQTACGCFYFSLSLFLSFSLFFLFFLSFVSFLSFLSFSSTLHSRRLCIRRASPFVRIYGLHLPAQDVFPAHRGRNARLRAPSSEQQVSRHDKGCGRAAVQ